MKPGFHVVVAKQWHRPEISIAVTNGGLEIAVPIDDFLQALCVQIGNPAKLLTKGQLERAVFGAGASIVDSLKRETVPLAGR